MLVGEKVRRRCCIPKFGHNEGEVKDIGGALPVEVFLCCTKVLSKKNKIKDIQYAISIDLLYGSGSGRVIPTATRCHPDSHWQG